MPDEKRQALEAWGPVCYGADRGQGGQTCGGWRGRGEILVDEKRFFQIDTPEITYGALRKIPGSNGSPMIELETWR